MNIMLHIDFKVLFDLYATSSSLFNGVYYSDHISVQKEPEICTLDMVKMKTLGIALNDKKY